MIENHTNDLANPPLNLLDPVLLAVRESLDSLNLLFTYSNNMQNPTLNPLASSEALGTTLVQPQMLAGGGNTSNSTPTKIPTINVAINIISSTNTSVLVGTVTGSNPGSTSTSYIGIPTGGCPLPNMGFPYDGAHQGQKLQGFNLNHFFQLNTCLGSTSRGNSTPWNGNIPSGGNGPWNMNTNWSNHLQMSGNVPRVYPPTHTSTMSRGNPTPPTTTMPGAFHL